MSKPFPPMVAAALLAAACSSGSPGDSVSDPDAAGAPADGAPTPEVDAASPPAPDLTTFHSDAARAVCGALFRCCDGPDLDSYFAPFRGSELLADFRDRLPPAASLDETECREVVAEMFAITPFGDWVDAARDGAVSFDGAAFASCVAALDDASCGNSARRALFDSSCLGFAAPGGGDEQRAMFARSTPVGGDCRPIRDGVGAAFFGNCDPHDAFCCFEDPAHPDLGCTFPFTGDGVPRAGTCAAAVTPGGACSATPPLAICRTGSSCDPYDLVCVGDSTVELAVGDTCVDDGFNLLGDCIDSFCDVLGSSKCEPLKTDGADCTGGYECIGESCVAGRCAVDTMCSGSGDGTPDAGPSAPDAAPPPPDAAPAGADAGPAAAGETCASAFGLTGASSPSALPGYDHVVAGGFGATDDYNPYDGASPLLPPACSFVYDAAGAELVYQIELEPGDRLDLRYAVEPNTIAGGIYLLDACAPEVSWPDYDGSGACGSNEYRSQGHCGFLGCDPIEWSWTYPTAVDGAPTSDRTFWIVVDHIGDTAATGYQLDWRVTHD